MKNALRASTVFSMATLLAASSLMGPVTAAYAANNVQSMDVASGTVPVDDSVASRDESSIDGEDTAVDRSLPADATESEDEGFSVDVSAPEHEVESVDSSFQYVYLAYPSLPSGTDQVVAFATPDDGDILASATLNYVSANGVQGTTVASESAGNSAAFVFGSTLKSNTYFLTSITYVLQGDGTEHVVDLSDRDYSFMIIDSSMNSESTSVYYADGDGNAVEAQSIQQALECTDSPDGISTYAERSARNVGVIALDAGHGGVDSGAQGNGKSEADLTWKIMTACKNKLEAYGFKIVLAREQSGYYPSNDYLYRVQRCIDQGAQAFVSFHINSGSSGAHGAEVYAPTANGTDYTQVSVELANKVMNNLAAMGLTYRGVFQMEVGDEFAVIRCAREQGIPGILIEHGFISNYGDVANYFSDDGCRRLGEADAAAIIAQFPHPYSVNGISFSEELGHAGSTVKIGVNVSGKTDGLRYKFVWHRAGSDWSDSNWGVIGQDLTSPSISWTLPQAGEYEIYADVIDSNGYVTSTSKYKVVNWSLESLEVSGDARCGKPVKLQAKVSGDASGLKYKFVWEKGGWAKWGVAQQPSASSSCEWTPTEPGEYTVYLDVIDGSAERHLTRKVTVGERYSVESLEVSGSALCGKPVKLQAKVSGDASGLKYKFVWEKGGWAKWGVAQQPSASSSCEWTPTEPGEYTVYLDVIDGSAERHLTRKVTVEGTPIMGSLQTSVDAMVNLYESTGHTYPSDAFVSKGAPTIRDFCSLIVEAAVSEGVRPEVVFAQAMLETGWLQFGGSVKPNQCNFAGLGAVNQQSGGARFDDVYQGLLAQVQHLKGYATGAALNNTCVDPRYEVLQSKGFLGVAPYLEDLNGRWAVPGDTYGQNIARIISLIG
ncbi:N-acetylmuramoyl-L-alanine amidase [Collinsella aerofaciens]|uniref:N-acetylmuramoyl-L-alanine amidase n=1 Tax=Collinsella aerofaciens TaxID=74426 RepID=UPI0006C6B8FF|nr:N-acetylmuramoyl-L-alanine amidase [Collinsella aerofaciens]CUN92401.1 N-acetylmuramoyl-L-alanine amidase LytC precursor [Collinsella aerofaciens]